MKRRALVALVGGVLLAATAGVLAQSGGYPARIFAQLLTLRSGTPQIYLTETDGAANNKSWSIDATAENLMLTLRDDAGGGFGFCQVLRTNQTADVVECTTTAFRINSIDLTPLSGSFVATLDDCCTTSPTVTFDYQKNGNLVTLKVVGQSGFAATGDSTNFVTTGTPVPAAIRPTAQNAWGNSNSGFINNATNTPGCLYVTTAGNIGFSRPTAADAPCATNGWSAAGSRNTPYGTSGEEFTYMLGNP